MKTSAIQAELEQIRNEHDGVLKPDDVVDWAANHKDSALHKHFTWDDGDETR